MKVIEGVIYGSMPIVLFAVFLVLRLTSIICMPWLWVTAPLWVSAAVGMLLVLVSLVVGGIVAIIAILKY